MISGPRAHLLRRGDSISPESIDQIPDSHIEELVRIMHFMRSAIASEEEREVYGLEVDEATDEETKTA